MNSEDSDVNADLASGTNEPTVENERSTRSSGVQIDTLEDNEDDLVSAVPPANSRIERRGEAETRRSGAA